jgi:HEAT repeat protein
MGLIEELIEKIRHGTKTDFEEAEDQIVVYSTDHSDEAIPALIPLLEDDNPDVRKISLESMISVAKYNRNKKEVLEAVPLLTKKLLRHTDPQVREMYSEIIYEIIVPISSRRALPILLEALEDRDVEIRKRAIDAIGRLQQIDAIKILREMRETSNEEMREHIDQAMRRLISSFA